MGSVQLLGERLRAAWASDRVRLALLAIYYLGIIAGLAAMYGDGRFQSPPFIYQEF